MAFHKSICFLTIFITFMSSSHAHTFQVGGKDGWTLHPSETYHSWSSRLRFLINDTLHFKYDDGSDSVLVVNKSDYDGCIVNNPITKMDGGDSVFKFDRSGPFYFITGNKSNCDQGQKVTVVVLALRKRSPPPSVATPPSSSTVPPSPVVSPVSPPSTAASPVLPPPTTGSPELSPYGTPVMSPPTPSPDGEMSPPAPSPDGESADSPGGGAADSPSGGSTGSPGGGTASSPGVSRGPSPGGSYTRANSTMSPSATTPPPLSGTVFASLVTMMFGLWGLI